TYLGSNSSLSVDPTFEENQEYDRQDFVLVDPTNSPKADAFLVRLRRTNDLQGLDNIPGVSSNGQPLPYLFGRGSLLNPEAKARGITVRATAIAQARPAVSVGVPFAELNPPLPGVTPFGLDRLALWDSPNFTPQSSLNATVDPRGNITITSPGFSAPPQGLFFSTPLTSIGQEVIEPAPVSENLKFPITGYVPIFQVVENSTGQKPLTRVIGFGRITMILAQGTPGQTPLNVQLMKLPSIIAPENASAVLAYPFAVTDQTEALNVFEALKNFHDPLLAPALVR
ncbi:MAG: hypothetical protein JO112_01540, partial [Planctomycetes bacterium]|nr:hypothetical protein [Planctomycetota bacterium]